MGTTTSSPLTKFEQIFWDTVAGPPSKILLFFCLIPIDLSSFLNARIINFLQRTIGMEKRIHRLFSRWPRRLTTAR